MTLLHTLTAIPLATFRGLRNSLPDFATARRLGATRRALARLDGHMLKDIGLDPLSARAEAEKPFWIR
jgi:uncharacterized protein YjiS (DUF1127 family)